MWCWEQRKRTYLFVYLVCYSFFPSSECLLFIFSDSVPTGSWSRLNRVFLAPSSLRWLVTKSSPSKYLSSPSFLSVLHSLCPSSGQLLFPGLWHHPAVALPASSLVPPSHPLGCSQNVLVKIKVWSCPIPVQRPLLAPLPPLPLR